MTFIPTCCLVAQSHDSRAPWSASEGGDALTIYHTSQEKVEVVPLLILSNERQKQQGHVAPSRFAPKKKIKTLCCESLRNLTWGVFHSRIKYLFNAVWALSWGVAALNTMPSGVITSLLIDATGQAEEVLQVVHTGASHRSARGLRRMTCHLWAKLPVWIQWKHTSWA